MTAPTCPHCGAEQLNRYQNGVQYVCGTFDWGEDRIEETLACLRNQLAAQAADVERLKQALEDYGDHSEKCKRKAADCFCGFDKARGKV